MLMEPPEIIAWRGLEFIFDPHMNHSFGNLLSRRCLYRLPQLFRHALRRSTARVHFSFQLLREDSDLLGSKYRLRSE